MKYLAAFLLLACSSILAQVTVVNPKHLDFPRDKVDVIFHMACKIVDEDFQIHHGTQKSEFPVTLVLGAPDEGYTEDEDHPLYTINLDHWNEVRFTMAMIGVAIQHMVVPQNRRDKLVLEVLRRSNQIVTVPVTTLAKDQK